MKNTLIKLSLFINYLVFAILLNSVGVVILQVQNSYGVSESSAGVLEAFKDLPIAITSFLLASLITRIGYKRSMLIALGSMAVTCMLMTQLNYFWMTKLLFAMTGVCFALVKMSVFATLGLVTSSRSEHASFMSFLESFFMVGVLSGYFAFSAFVDDTNPGSARWLHVYYLLAGLLALAFTLLQCSSLDESSVFDEKSKPNYWEEFIAMLRLCTQPLVLVFITSAFLYVLIEQSIMSWLPSFNSNILMLPASLSIQMASILAAATALGRFVSGFLVVRFNWLYIVSGGLVLAAVLVLVVLPLARQVSGEAATSWANAPLAAFVFPMIGFLIAPVYPVVNSAVLSAMPIRSHGPMSGLIVVFSALGGTSGSIITGHLFEYVGGLQAFYFSLLPLGLLIFTLYRFKKYSDVQSELALSN